jgi:hypothetical protein
MRDWKVARLSCSLELDQYFRIFEFRLALLARGSNVTSLQGEFNLEVSQARFLLLLQRFEFSVHLFQSFSICLFARSTQWRLPKLMPLCWSLMVVVHPHKRRTSRSSAFVSLA